MIEEVGDGDAPGSILVAPRQHQVERPTLTTARTALAAYYGPHTEDVWRTLLFRSGLTGEETDLASVGRVISAMENGGGPLARLCGRGLAVRLQAYERLGKGRGE